MKIAKNIIFAGIIAAGLPALASAASFGNDGYWVDSSGTIIRNGTGGCWHTIFWTPSMAVAGCDPVNEMKMTHPIIVKPIAAPQPKSAVQTKISLSEEDLFNFNKYELKPTGKAKLDNLVHDLNGSQYDAVHVTGYTDRIGSVKYNLKLSLRRANEVKSYLESKGIPAERIHAEGKGKSQPITKPNDCRGMTKAGIIACLQPDRRVEVTVDGTKGVIVDPK